ncbi:FAD/NAD(P)-binding protein [Aquimarina muelleri]|uniref:FAD-dependent urate hydroxylase HpyO/Asp monooxygenase CreE-like FAD/NAD(P)-binding domain-containing protein n=1 Tax=Aquimarina muelleri TaxID=279356 RepID=A0A918JYT0_9FLAO|nr:FAD/NAD(P)-binding protein [Aquimarina muelleri]MCX2764915.1 FAD/NAD(P)-binding protein [Aquimarina muelleri]GGX30672.1 hypothetical protein GCM10007384_34730 [Aquimarina muelleri]
MKKIETLAIIGCGPRGLSSLESLLKHLSKSNFIPNIKLFDSYPFFGAGRVWRTDQVETNWINISDKALKSLQGREPVKFENFTIPGFPSFIEWFEIHKFKFPKNTFYFIPRKVMGEYLMERFNSVKKILQEQNKIELFELEVSNVVFQDGALLIETPDNEKENADECLITIGHQPTFPSDQIKKWHKLSKTYGLQLELTPYDIKLDKRIDKNRVIAIRGFGLATLDLFRLFGLNDESKFKENKNDCFLRYKHDQISKNTIIPFSLDGLPPVPKPYNIKVDSLFDPEKELTEMFEIKIKNGLKANELFPQYLVETFISTLIPVLNRNPNCFLTADFSNQKIKDISSAWLKDSCFKHDCILDTDLEVTSYMKKTVLMAHHKTGISLDYAIGQLWRHLQPSMYKLFSYCGLDDTIMEEIINIDERLKRYSYGPPVDSIKQVIALSDEGVINFDLVKDPEVNASEDGWILKNNESMKKADIMINAVLDSPVLKEINSDIILNLLNNNVLKAVTSSLGVETFEDGQIKTNTYRQNSQIYMLGRNCKGSVLGVDAILECFGKRVEDWAKNCASRVNKSNL